MTESVIHVTIPPCSTAVRLEGARSSDGQSIGLRTQRSHVQVVPGALTMTKPLTVRASQCATCPFRETGWTQVRDLLIQRSLTQATPIYRQRGTSQAKER